MTDYSVSTDPVVLHPDEPTQVVVTDGALAANGVDIAGKIVVEEPTAITGEGSFSTMPEEVAVEEEPKPKRKPASEKKTASKRSTRKAKK